MSSAIDTLLEAARFIELQEQQQLLQQQEQQRTSSFNGTTPNLGTNLTNGNTTNITNGNTINITNGNTTRPGTSLNRISTTGTKYPPNKINSVHKNNQQSTRILSPISATLASSARHPSLASSNRKRTISNSSNNSFKEEPITNGHSSPSLVGNSLISSPSPALSVASSTLSTIQSQQKHYTLSNSTSSILNNNQQSSPVPVTIDLSTKSLSAITTINGSVVSHPNLISNPPSSTGVNSFPVDSVHLLSTPNEPGVMQSIPDALGPIRSTKTLTISPIDDSQSSLNLSSGSSGYITNGSANSSSSSSTLNLSTSSPTPASLLSLVQPINGLTTSPLPKDQFAISPQANSNSSTLAAGGRRRTTSSNSNGAGTREVHNKLEKNRRAHLKECFEQLKKQLTLMPDEKKTSNLSILGAAIRHIHHLKRKERELEHEMERLAKEKIAAQNRILLLKRELSQWDIDCPRLVQEADIVPPDRENTNEPGINNGNVNGLRFNPSSLSNNALPSGSSLVRPSNPGIYRTEVMDRSDSLTENWNLPSTTISPVLITSSPSRASPPSRNLSPATSSTANLMMPLSLTTKSSTMNHEPLNGMTTNASPLKLSTTPLPNGLNLSTSGSGHNSPLPFITTMSGNLSAINLRTATVVDSQRAQSAQSCTQQPIFHPGTTLLTGPGTSIQTLPLNLNASGKSCTPTTSTPASNYSTTPGLQIISTNGKDLNGSTMKNSIRNDNKIEIIATQGGTLDQQTKVIKLLNGIALAPMDKDSKMFQLSQVGGGLVVNPIQLLPAQGLRVIQQPSSNLATIELSSPQNVPHQRNMTNSINGSIPTTIFQSQPSSVTHLPPPVTGAQLHKLLISGPSNGLISSSNITTNGNTVTTSIAPELARLPGGAELNILPGTNGTTTTIYRQSGKVNFVTSAPTNVTPTTSVTALKGKKSFLLR